MNRRSFITWLLTGASSILFWRKASAATRPLIPPSSAVSAFYPATSGLYRFELGGIFRPITIEELKAGDLVLIQQGWGGFDLVHMESPTHCHTALYARCELTHSCRTDKNTDCGYKYCACRNP